MQQRGCPTSAIARFLGRPGHGPGQEKWLGIPAGGHREAAPRTGRRKEKCQMALILWIIAVVLVVAGIITLISGSVIFGIVLIVVGLLVGPGGVSIFGRGNRV